MGQPYCTPCFPSNHSDSSRSTFTHASLSWFMALNPNTSTDTPYLQGFPQLLLTYFVINLLQIHKHSIHLPILLDHFLIQQLLLHHKYLPRASSTTSEPCLLFHYFVLCSCSNPECSASWFSFGTSAYLCKTRFTGTHSNWLAQPANEAVIGFPWRCLCS